MTEYLMTITIQCVTHAENEENAKEITRKYFNTQFPPKNKLDNIYVEAAEPLNNSEKEK